MSEQWKMIHQRFDLWRTGVFFLYQGNTGLLQGLVGSPHLHSRETGIHRDRQHPAGGKVM